MSSVELELIISGGFIVWLSGYASGAILRFFRNIITTSTQT